MPGSIHHSALPKADIRGRLQRVDSGSCVERQRNHESREAKTGALLGRWLMEKPPRTVRPYLQHRAKSNHGPNSGFEVIIEGSIAYARMAQ